MISLENLGVKFSQEQPSLFEQVNLAVCRGETFVIVGASGAGKSVLLKLLAGLIQPTYGAVRTKGKSGMLFQKNALFDSMTVEENLAFPLRENGGLTQAEIAAKVRTYLDYVSLGDIGGLFPSEISGGMQKRVGIARALILNPDIIYYDDPTAGLDPITSRTIIELILTLKKKFGTTIVAVTNEMNRAFQMADRLGIVLDQRLVVTGTPEETKKFPDAQVQYFIKGGE